MTPRHLAIDMEAELTTVAHSAKAPLRAGWRALWTACLFAAVSASLLGWDPTPADGATYSLLVSHSPDRSGAEPLQGATVSGQIYVFLSPATGVDHVRFYLGDPDMVRFPRQIEDNAPYDFAGGTETVANAFDTGSLPRGSQIITAAVSLQAGGTAIVNATFIVADAALVLSPDVLNLSVAPGGTTTANVVLNTTVASASYTITESASWLTVNRTSGSTPATLTLTLNAGGLTAGNYTTTLTASAPGYASDELTVMLTVGVPSSGFGLKVSSKPDRSSSVLLGGATVEGNIYVFTAPDTGVEQVTFYLNDPKMTGSPSRIENSAPFDFAGTNGSVAYPFDTTDLTDGSYTITAAVELTTGTTVVSSTFMIVNGSQPVPGGDGGGNGVTIVGAGFNINGRTTYLGSRAEGLLMNVRMVNSVFEDENRPEFDPEANTNEFLAVLPDYVAHGVRAFTVSLQGGNPGYEGAVNSAFRSDGSLKPVYLARVKRVIQAADARGAVIILSLFYQRQDQRLANDAAIRAGVVNVMRWLSQEGFSNVLVEIANEYPHGGFFHALIRTTSGIKSLIQLGEADRAPVRGLRQRPRRRDHLARGR